MKSCHVLCRIDRFEDALGVDRGREGKLDEDAVDGLVAVQSVNEAQHLFSADGCGGCVHPTGDAELFARGDFGFDVELRGGIFADEDRSQTRANAFMAKADDFVFQLGEDFIADFSSVENPCGHRSPLSFHSIKKNQAYDTDPSSISK